MTVFLQSLGSRVAKAVTKPFSAPLTMRILGPILLQKSLMQMLKAHYVLLQALNDDDIARVIHCKSVYEI